MVPELPCSCNETEASDNSKETATGEVTSNLFDEPLPEALQNSLEDLVDADEIRTIEDWIDEIQRHTDGSSLSLDDLCSSDEPTGHRGEVDGDTYHFLCFYDAVILASLADSEARIQTETPTGETVTATVDGDSLNPEPEDAVYSIGVERDVEPSGESATHEDVYEAMCPYVKAFVDEEEYRHWDEYVDAATLAAPLEDATELAWRLTP